MLDKVKGIVFDLDGTLIDSMGVWVKADRNALESLGAKPPEDFLKYIQNMTAKQIMDYWISTYNLNVTPEQLYGLINAEINNLFRNTVDEKPNAMKFVRYVHSKGIKIGIATNNTKEMAIEMLKKFDVYGYISTIRTCSELKKPKPFPDVYIAACRDLGLNPRDCLAFEDLPAGMAAAQSAGLKVCAVKDVNSDHLDDQKRQIANYYITDFDQVMNNTYITLKK